MARKSAGYDFWEIFHHRPREATARKIKTASALPQYNPDEEAEEVRDLRNRKLPSRFLFRYATWFDFFLMFVGLVSAVICGITYPLLVNKQGDIFHRLEVERCEKMTNWSGNYTASLNPPYPETVSKWFISTMEYFAVYLFTFVLFVACFAIAAENQISQLRIAYFEALVRKDMSWLDNFVEREFGRHMTHDITQIRLAIGEKLCYVVYAVVTTFGLLITSIAEQWKLSVVVLGLGPILLCIGYIGAKAANREATYVETVNTNSGIYAEETFANIKTVKVYEGEEKEAEKFESALSSKFGWRWILLGTAAGATHFILLSSFAIIFYFGSAIVREHLQNRKQCVSHTAVNEEEDGPEDLLVVFFCVFYASLHIFELPTLINQLCGAKQVAAEVFFMIDWKPRIDNMAISGDLPEGGVIGKIEFENVSFRYPRKPGRSALNNIHMVIYPGQVIAFVGPMACGKSTILHLIQRLYDPTAGNIFIDGHNIENVNVQWLRSHIAKVSQEPVLFNKSVEDNVRYAKWGATTAEVQKACKKAGIHDEIMQLKKGYQTIVGQHGNVLNTSQKRQLSFARAYLQAPKILLLDDPIAGCVPEFEELVLGVINGLRDKTTIILASSVINSLVQNCDRICCMEHGTILEQGNHEELTALEGVYVGLRQAVTTGIDQNKYISQLTSYRFSQSLRRMHLRKAKATAHQQARKKSNPGQRHRSVDPTSASFIEATKHALHHDNRVKINQAVVLRVAGGLQNCNYTRTQANSIGHIRRNLTKAVKKVQHEMEMKQEMFGAEQSISTIFATKMRHQRESFSLQYDQLANTMKPRGSVGSESLTAHFVDEDRKSIVSSARSIASEDSVIFWADYEEMLDNLEDMHSVTSWGDIITLGKMQWMYVLAVVLTSISMGLLMPIYYILIDNIFDAFAVENADKSQGITNLWCLYLVILGLVSGIVAFVQELVCSYGGFKMVTNLRRKLFAHILKQDQEWFDKPENDVSFLCARLSTDTTLVGNVLILSVGSITQSVTSLLMTYCLAFAHLEGVLVVSACAFGMGIVQLVVIYFDAWFQKEFEWITDIVALEEATEIEIDVITNIRTVITLGLEAHFLNDFKNEIKKSKKKLFGINLLRSVLFGSANSLPYGFFSIVVYIFYLHNKFGHRFAEILAVTGLQIFGVIPIGTALALIPNTSLSLAAAYRVNKIFSTKPKSANQAKFTTPKQVSFEMAPKIELRNLEFSFNSNIQYSMLRDINLMASSEEKIAVVGPSGCGKSSIIQLLLGLYHPTSGQILVDGMEFGSIDLKSIRKITSYVEQNPTIFDCSITENIAYGDNSREVPMTEIIRAAKLSHAHDEIMALPDGYDTQISSLDSFQEYSFGLRQRIVYARALLRDPKLLLIDESTASVDPQSDLLLLKTLDECCIGRTTIITSQRIEAIRNADLIIMLKNGQLIEKGTDLELIDHKGEYYHMYVEQRQADGLRSNSEDLHYGHEIEDFYKRVSITAESKRRRSSVQYQNYLKDRLIYGPERSDSEGPDSLSDTVSHMDSDENEPMINLATDGPGTRDSGASTNSGSGSKPHHATPKHHDKHHK